MEDKSSERHEKHVGFALGCDFCDFCEGGQLFSKSIVGLSQDYSFSSIWHKTLLRLVRPSGRDKDTFTPDIS